MFNIDLNAMHVVEFPEYPYILQTHVMRSKVHPRDLCVDLQFPTKEAIVGAIKKHNFKLDVDYNIVISMKTKYVGEC